MPTTTLGDLIADLYADFLEAYGDEEFAAVATAAAINDYLGSRDSESED